jgi:NAD(P)-dependent dehydrogenase (short-subunit alcohol dehydrogenase family)
MTNLKNKIALITGSARRIGKAIAERYGSSITP